MGSMLDTDQLRSFLAIVDTGSFTRAAERVHKTQSAVSMHIRRLEEQLGCALFVKQGRGARLTEEGERLIEFASSKSRRARWPRCRARA
jgi:DNA-binding transcriptional LysR family regulator